MPREVQQEVVFKFLHLCVAQHVKKNLKLQVVLLMEDEVRDDGEMQMDKEKMMSELWVQERMELWEYMETLQETEVEMEDQTVVEILVEMNLEFR